MHFNRVQIRALDAFKVVIFWATVIYWPTSACSSCDASIFSIFASASACSACCRASCSFARVSCTELFVGMVSEDAAVGRVMEMESRNTISRDTPVRNDFFIMYLLNINEWMGQDLLCRTFALNVPVFFA